MCVQFSLLNLVIITVQIYVGPREEMIGRKGVCKISDLKMAKLQSCLLLEFYLYPEQSTGWMLKIAVFPRQISRELYESQ